MVTQFLASAVPATTAAVSMALVLMVVLMTGLTVFCVRMMSGPAAWLPSTPAASTSSRTWTVEEWIRPDGTVHRVTRSEVV